jgi:N-acyl-D-aspartate/D-glutamate deacylase
MMMVSYSSGGVAMSEPDSTTVDAVNVDIVIRGGLVVDGTGAPGVLADVAVSDGRIVAIGADLVERGYAARDVLDAL